MNQFVVLKGSHIEGGKTYSQGETVKSDKPLNVLFSTKFQAPSAVPVVPAKPAVVLAPALAPVLAPVAKKVDDVADPEEDDDTEAAAPSKRKSAPVEEDEDGEEPAPKRKPVDNEDDEDDEDAPASKKPVYTPPARSVRSITARRSR